MAKFSLKKSLAASRADENGMQWYECAEYGEVKEYIKGNLQKIQENFVAVGYWLKYVKDNKMYVEDGYKSIEEFAQAVYQISKSTTYRLMEINTNFSKNGNSPELAEEYRDFSKSQLQELLTLTDRQREEVTPEMTVDEIRQVKKENQPDDGMIRRFCYLCLRNSIKKQDYIDAKSLKAYLQKEFGKSYEGYGDSLFNYGCTPRGITFGMEGKKYDEITWSAFSKRIMELYEIDHLTLELPEAEVLDGQMEMKEEPKCEELMLETHKVVEVQEKIQESKKPEPEQDLKPYQRGCITGASPYGICSCCGTEGVKCCAACKKDCNVRCGWYQNEDAEPDERVELEESAEQADDTHVDFEPFNEEVLPILSYTRGNVTDSIPFMNEQDMFIFDNGHKYAALTMKLQKYIAEQINVLDLDKYRIEIRAVKIK